MAKQSKQAALAASLRRQGFDKAHVIRGTTTVRPRCSQCEALVIQGVACHERGCPNARRARDEED